MDQNVTVATQLDVVWFQVLNISATVIVLGIFAWQSLRSRRVTPLLAMSIGMLSISWLEAPFDWAQWCQFHPELARIPPWGPFAMTSGGLPIMNPICYVFFLGIPVALSTVVAKWLARHWNANRIIALLLVGFIIGGSWDYPNQMFGIHAGWWRYARGIEGLTVNAGTPYTFSLGELVFMSTNLMMLTYFFGRRDDRDRTLMEAWADRAATSSKGRLLYNIGASVLVSHLIFGTLFIPFLIAKLNNLFTEVYTGELFPGLAPQPGPLPDPADGWLGVLVIVGGTMLFLAIFVITVLSKDPQARGASSRWPAASSA